MIESVSMSLSSSFTMVFGYFQKENYVRKYPSYALFSYAKFPCFVHSKSIHHLELQVSGFKHPMIFIGKSLILLPAWSTWYDYSTP